MKTLCHFNFPELYISIFLCLAQTSIVIAQVKGNYQIINEKELFYADTTKTEITFGDYEATDIINTPDDGFLISTIFHISYIPEQYDTLLNRADKKTTWRDYYNHMKSHTSSGSILKLDKHYNRLWEIKLRDRRVRRMQRLDSQSILILGERVEQTKLWIAKINIIDGKLLWLKDYKVGHTFSYNDISVQPNGEILMLSESEKLIPLRIYKYYGRTKIEVLKTTFSEGNLFLSKLSANGKLLWHRKVQGKRKYNYFGDKIISSNDTIFITELYDGFPKHKKKVVTDKGFAIVTLTPKGKFIARYKTENSELLTYQNGLILSQTKGDSLLILKFQKDTLHLLEQFIVPSSHKGYSIKSFVPVKNNIILCGRGYVDNEDYLICKANSDLHPIDYWVYERKEFNQLIKVVETSSGNLLLVGWCYRENGGDKLIKYINLVEVRPND